MKTNPFPTRVCRALPASVTRLAFMSSALLLSCASEPAFDGEPVGTASQSAAAPPFVKDTFMTTYSNFTTPGTGFDEKEIDLKINADPGPGASYFFSHQVGFENSIAYIGLQTDGTGKYGFGKIAIFSIWNATGGLPGESNAFCTAFGGEGVGYSCRMGYSWKEGGSYRLRIKSVGTDLWGAWIVDLATLEERELGVIVAASGTGKLTADSTTFTESYGPDFPACSWLPRGQVSWSVPTVNGTTKGSWVANSIGPGDCASLRTSTGTGPTVHTMGSPTPCGYLTARQELDRGDVLRSCDGRFKLIMQNDGNLVLYQSHTALWSTGQLGGARFVLGTDGNLILYNASGDPAWTSWTPDNAGAYLRLQDDGNLVLYSQSRHALWTTQTFGH